MLISDMRTKRFFLVKLKKKKYTLYILSIRNMLISDKDVIFLETHKNLVIFIDFLIHNGW